MNINYKRSLKLITLLLTSIIIATVSAQAYMYMYIDGSITINASKLLWIADPSAPSEATISISGSTVTLDLAVVNGTLRNFTECLLLKNENVSGSFSLVVSIPTAVSASDFDTCNAYIYTNSSGSWVYVDTLTMTNSADTWSGSLAAGNYLRFAFEVKAKPEATSSKAFDIQVRYN